MILRRVRADRLALQAVALLAPLAVEYRTTPPPSAAVRAEVLVAAAQLKEQK